MLLKYCNLALVRLYFYVGLLNAKSKQKIHNIHNIIPVGMKIGKSIVFEVENQKMKVKTLKKIRFWLKCGSYQSKENKVLRLISGCQTITEKVQMQL